MQLVSANLTSRTANTSLEMHETMSIFLGDLERSLWPDTTEYAGR
jgi:hypothetical protein